MIFVLNIFDVIVVDYLWVYKIDYWTIPELSDLAIGKMPGQMTKERIISSLVFIPIAALLACLAFIA